ncbi:NADP(H)-dependent aldo-keto reductase [Namhaeicola litoreus]|uniref:NADP(H)-dependent aldo-keto reductase n=1 Tax=Namhaeicola litoreus TaxID=1052145 RepID=A0ABW3XYH2_9FLAO
MKYSFIPNTNIEVSKICLGTMTYGQQNTEAEAHEQLNYAVERGVNFIDTAEMYSIPGKKETQGSTERYIGSWLKDQKRENLVVATKITGPNIPYFSYIRDDMRYTKKNLQEALHNNLKRLQTDYVDIYQLHWPERNVNMFGQRNYKHNPNDPWKENFKEVIEILDGFVKEGKIRHYGVSNETPYGVMKQLQTSEKYELTRCKTIQNSYSLLNRIFEIHLAEISMRENVGLLAYSPLAFGVLTGKYLNGQKPEGSRLKLFPQYARYSNPQATEQTKAYKKLADKLGISLTHLSLAFVNQQPFVTGNIIGATTMEQLKENIDSINVELSTETLKEIDRIQELSPNPAP